jgi:site-specific DNA-methyltransferase (adenine-specific)/modification methylase
VTFFLGLEGAFTVFTAPGDVVLDNAFGSGSFLVAAALEGGRYIGIEKNEEVHLFKEERIDYMRVARERLGEVRMMMKAREQAPPLFSDLQPSARVGRTGRRGMIDVDDIVSRPEGIAV